MNTVTLAEAVLDAGGAQPSRAARPILLLAATATLLTCCLLSLHGFQGVDDHHDGLMLVPAIEVASGQVLYRDVFYQYGPLSAWIQAGSVKVFGPRLTSIRWVTIAAYAACAAVLVLCLSRLVALRWCAVALVWWLLTSPAFRTAEMHSWSSVYAMVFQFGAWLAALEWLARERPRRLLILAGGLSSLAFWCRQPVGLLLFLGLLGGTVVLGVAERPVRPRRVVADASALSGGFLLPAIPILATFWFYGALHDLYTQAWVFPGVMAKASDYMGVVRILTSLFPESPWPALGELAFGLLAMGAMAGVRGSRRRWLLGLGAAAGLALAACTYPRGIAAWLVGRHPATKLCMYAPWMVFVWGTLGATFIGLARLFLPAIGSGSRQEAQGVFLTGAVAIASWAQFYPVPCPRHGFWAVGPMLACLVWLLTTVSRKRERPGRPFAWRSAGAVLVVLVLSRAFVWGAVHVSRSRPGAPVRLEEPAVLRGISVQRPRAGHIASFVDAVRRALDRTPGRRILLWGGDGMPLLYFPEATYPPPLFIVWPPMIEIVPDMLATRLALIAEHLPLVIQQKWPAYEPLERLLADHYTPIWRDTGGTVLWEPRADAAE